MSIFYKSPRVGKNGEIFNLYKIKTLKKSDKSLFAQKDNYTYFGRFLRKTKLDELPQLFNVFKGDMNFFGYRAEEERTFDLIPEQIREILLKNKPGIIDLSSLQFFEEEKILQLTDNPSKIYWERIKPIKFALQCFYIENRCFLLNLAIIWIAFKKVFKSLFK